MPKKISLEAITAAAEKQNNVVTLSRDDAKAPSHPKHTSLYLSPEVRQAIREIAFQYDRKYHELYLEGIDLMLAKYGKPTSKELEQK